MVRFMSMYVGYISALRYWRGMGSSLQAMHVDSQGNLSDLFGTGKMELVVDSDNQRTDREHFSYHVCTQRIPQRSYRRVGVGLYVAQPELCFLQMATKLSLVGLVQLGMEMCGSYRLDGDNGFVSACQPLMSKESLLRFLADAKGCYGVEKARRAARLIVEGSASPRETQTCIRLCLPLRYGGYSLPSPVMNGLMELTREQQRLSNRSRLYGDLYWPERNVLLEYNGEQFHASREQMARDAIRANAVSAQDVRMFTVTAGVYGNSIAFDALAREVQRALRVRYRAPNETQLELRNRLPRELRLQEVLSR